MVDCRQTWWFKEKNSRGNYTVDVKEEKKKRATGSFSWYCRAAGPRREDKTWNIYLLQPIEVKTVCGSVDVSRRDDNSRFYNNFSKHIMSLLLHSVVGTNVHSWKWCTRVLLSTAATMCSLLSTIRTSIVTARGYLYISVRFKFIVRYSTLVTIRPVTRRKRV